MLAERVKALIGELGLSQRQFSLKVDIDTGYLSKIIQGKVVPSDRILKVIANTFDVNIEWLKTGEGEMFTSDSNTASRRRVLELIDTLNDKQLDKVTKFIKCFLDEDN